MPSRHSSYFPYHPAAHLGDFTTTTRVLPIALLAIAIGVVATYVAAALLKFIGFFTNLFFFQRIDTTLAVPAGHHLGAFVILVPVAGGLIIGLMARFGSEKIRGHGIPEAIEAILINGSRVQPKVALLKPLSAAISIGSGGPFGAEGPIILTGGAIGSLVAQFFHLTSAERKTLLVAGAAAGMSATFAAPVASVLLGVELLLFEWKPRSIIPVALASVTAGALRRHVLGLGPVFPVPAHPASIGVLALGGCLVVGLLAGVMSALLTQAVYASEDVFARLPIHWMWWPMIGGLIIGVGGYIFPEGLGVGYEIIGSLLQGDAPMRIIAGVLLVKSLMWALSLGSGTSGGVVAPLLMMGGALGGLEAHFLPWEGAGFWAVISMGAMLGGTMRAPLTGVIFALELTHDINTMLPLLLAVAVAYGFTVLVQKRSILTEKIGRRGYHLSAEYAVDPLEIIFAREVVRTNVATLPVETTRDLALAALAVRSGRAGRHPQRLFPVVDERRTLVGVVPRRALREWIDAPVSDFDALIERSPLVAYTDDPLRLLVFGMAERGVTRIPVISREDDTLVGLVALRDLLMARTRVLEAERRRERVLGRRIRLPEVFNRRANV